MRTNGPFANDSFYLLGMRRLVLLLVPLVIIASCKSDDDEKSPEDRYVADLARAICVSLEPCCTQNELSGFDQGRCELGAAGFIAKGVDGAKARGATFDQAAANACIEGTSRQAKACKTSGDDKELSATCGRVFVGPKKAGEACSSDGDCASSAEGRGVCSKNVCVIAKRGAVDGSECPAFDCAASDLQCLLDNKCHPLTAIGADCPGFTKCVNGAYCDASGKCAATLAPGSACTKNEECSTGACIRGKCGQNALATVTPCTGQSQ